MNLPEDPFEDVSLVEKHSNGERGLWEDRGDSIMEGPLAEEMAPIPWKENRAGSSQNSTKPSVGPMFKVLKVIKVDITEFQEMYGIPIEFLLHVLRPED